VPQIPHQALIRFTRERDWVLDVFAGSGTSLIKCKQLNRNSIGIELVPKVAALANKLIEKQNNPSVFAKVIVADSASSGTTKRVKAILAAHKTNKVQLIIMHPPYFNVIRFSENPKDLSNAPSIEAYLRMFEVVTNNFADLLEEGRYLVLVMGDVYLDGEYIPLASETMQIIRKTCLFKLKSTVIKNINGNRGKRGQESLWNYRVLKNGLFIFKHEYIYFFQKIR